LRALQFVPYGHNWRAAKTAITGTSFMIRTLTIAAAFVASCTPVPAAEYSNTVPPIHISIITPTGINQILPPKEFDHPYAGRLTIKVISTMAELKGTSKNSCFSRPVRI
jgi:hypothetical protein